MKPNRFRQALAEGRVPLGHMVMEFATRGIAKILETANPDFVIYDMEHSNLGNDRIADLIAWSKACPFAPFVRVPQGQYHFLARVMDAGALGVMVGNVETPEEARDIVRAVKYAPMGARGVGLGTAHNDYLMPNPAAYFAEANASSVVICQIESEKGLENARAIAAVEGVDVLWIGHFDLSQAMGIPGQFEHPRFIEAMRTVCAAAKEHGKHAAMQPGTIDQVKAWAAHGFDVFGFQTDIAAYRGAVTGAFQKLRELFAK